MSLVGIATSETEPDVALVRSALQAAGIPHFVHGGAVGGLLPGLQFGSFNTKSVMVPASCAEFAIEIIGSLHLSSTTVGTPPPREAEPRPTLWSRLSAWFVPGRQPPSHKDEGESKR